MKILISAAETSSDTHGAKLLEAIRQLAPQVEAFGIGGPKLQAAGLRAVVDARELLSMGFTEVLGRLPRILRALKRVSAEAEREKPDVAVVIDYPDFHFKLAERLKAQGVPVIYFIPPKVWVWRKSRLKTLRERFTKLLCIFPFEQAFYEREGMSVKFVGNPLIDELPLKLTRTEARRSLGLSEDEKVVVLMPGSRPSELKQHLDLMIEAASLTARKMGSRLRVLLPFPQTSDLSKLTERVLIWSDDPGISIRVSQGDAPTCLVAADAGLIKSGTSTLEAALLGCPHAVVYKPGLPTEVIFKAFIRYEGPVGLVNLVADPEGPKARPPYLAREILMDEVTPEVLAGELRSLLTDVGKRERIQAGFERLRNAMRSESSPSLEAAKEILATCRSR